MPTGTPEHLAQWQPFLARNDPFHIFSLIYPLLTSTIQIQNFSLVAIEDILMSSIATMNDRNLEFYIMFQFCNEALWLGYIEQYDGFRITDWGVIFEKNNILKKLRVYRLMVLNSSLMAFFATLQTHSTDETPPKIKEQFIKSLL